MFHQLCFPLCAAWRDLIHFIHAKGEQWSPGSLWMPINRAHLSLDKMNKVIPGWSLDWFEHRIGPLLPDCSEMGIPQVTGRLACSIEGTGKLRLEVGEKASVSYLICIG